MNSEHRSLPSTGNSEKDAAGPTIASPGPMLLSVARAAVVAVTGTLLAVGWLSRLVAVLGLPRLAAPPLVLLIETVLACGLPLTGALVTLHRHAAMESDGG